MIFLGLKYLHIISMVLLFGTGLGSAFYKWMADRSKDVGHIAATNRRVVLADWLFTSPTIMVQPITGVWMASLLGIPLTTPWLATSLGLYVLAGMCWLPVVYLQIRMRDLAQTACLRHSSLPEQYWRYARLWFWLGVPAFVAMLVIVYLMVVKPAGEF